MNTRFALSAILAVGLAPVAAVKADVVPTQYTVVALGVNDASSVNGAGQVVGSATQTFGSPRKAYFWDGSSINWMSMPGYSTATALGVNGSNVVGTATPIGSFAPKGYLYNAGNVTILPTLGGASSAPAAINASGLIVGSSQDASGVIKAAAWNGGVVTGLGTLGGPTSNATDVNGNGQVTGHSRISAANGIFRAFIHNGSTMSALPALSESGNGFAFGINDSGAVVGAADEAGVRKPVYWNSGQISKLSNLQGQANDINNSGTIVGYTISGINTSAFVFKNGQMIDLNTKLPANSGWKLYRALSINETGHIVCVGLQNGAPRACVLRF